MKRRSYKEICLDYAKINGCEVHGECSIFAPVGYGFVYLKRECAEPTQAWVDLKFWDGTYDEAWKEIWKFIKDGIYKL